MYNDKSFVSSHSSHINNNNNCNKIRRFMSIFFKNVWLFGSNIHCIAWNRSDLGDNKKLSEINRCKKDNTHTHTTCEAYPEKSKNKRIELKLYVPCMNNECEMWEKMRRIHFTRSENRPKKRLSVWQTMNTAAIQGMICAFWYKYDEGDRFDNYISTNHINY